MTPNEPLVHDSDRIDDAVAYRLYRTNRLLLTHLGRFLGGAIGGLTPEKWFVLAHLYQDGPMRQGELTDSSLDDAPNISRMVEALVKDGLVSREQDSEDRRGRVIGLTKTGATTAKELLDLAVAERHLVFGGFSEAELQVLSRALDRVDANVRQLLNNDGPP